MDLSKGIYQIHFGIATSSKIGKTKKASGDCLLLCKPDNEIRVILFLWPMEKGQF
jgi:hypothetical protein